MSKLRAIPTRLHLCRLSRPRTNTIDALHLSIKQQTIVGSNSPQLLCQLAFARHISSIHYFIENKEPTTLRHKVSTNTQVSTNTPKTGDIATKWDLFMSLQTVRPAPFTADDIGDLLVELAQSSLPDKIPKALFLRQVMDEHNFLYTMRHFKVFIDLYASSGEPRTALIITKQLGKQIDRHLYFSLLKSFVENESIADAFEVYKQSSEANALLSKKDHHYLLSRLLRAGMFTEAKYTIAEMNNFGLSSNVYTYTMIIDAYAKQGQLDKAVAMFESMSTRGVMPNTHTYTVMIDAHAKHRNMNKALAIFKSMLLHRVMPSSHTYSVMIKVYVELGKLEEAISMFKLSSPRDIEQDSYLCVAMISAYTKCLKLENAIILFESLRSTTLSRSSELYTAMIDGYAKNGRLDDAIELFESMPANKVERKVETYVIMIDVFAKAGQLEKAVTLFETMEVAKNPYTYIALLGAYGKHGRLKEAVALFELMETKGIEYDMISYTAIANMHVKQHKLIEAKRYLQTMHEKYSTELLFKSHPFICLLMDYYNRCCQHNLVVILFHKFKETCENNIGKLRPGVSILLDSAGRNTDLETVQSTWRELGTIKGLQLNTNNYSSYIEALCHCNATEAATNVLVKMMPQAKVRMDLKAIYTLLSCLLKAEKFEEFEKACLALQDLYPDFFQKWDWKLRSLPSTKTVKSWNITSFDINIIDST